jgi:hypothetical protein
MAKFKVGDTLKRTDFYNFVGDTRAAKEFRIKVINIPNGYYEGLVTKSDNNLFVKQGTIVPFFDDAPFEIDTNYVGDVYYEEEML